MTSISAAIAERLAEARARTLLLVTPLSEDDLRRQHDPLMSPVLWDLGHIAHFEELWLTRNLTGDIESAEMPGLYNPFEHPRATRASLPLPTLHQLLARMAEIRARVLDQLERVELDGDNPLLRDGYVYNMVLQHEYQHNETILQTLQLKQGEPYRAPRVTAARQGCDRDVVSARGRGAMVRLEGGAVAVGTDDRTAAYDNERPARTVTLAPFEIGAVPVTNADFQSFMSDGGYARTELWSRAGQSWLDESGVRAPAYWRREGEVWMTRVMDRVAPVEPDHPVCHVCFHEADAYARWAGMRLPTEYEWEAAAAWDAVAGVHRDYPWGDSPPSPLHANVDQLGFGTAPVGAYERNISPAGCHGMIGDVWEWTSSDFTRHKGYESFPYPEYSEAFFGGDFKVLRGGSWATRSGAVRNSFRNWDFPIRRQIFSGFRCARDV